MSSSSISGHRRRSPTTSSSARDEPPARFAPSSTKSRNVSVPPAHGPHTSKDTRTPSGSSLTASTASSTRLPKRPAGSTTSSASGGAPNDSSSHRPLEGARAPRQLASPSRARLRTLCDGVLALLWASRCAVCDSTLDEPTRGIVCADCWRRIELIAPPVCRWCGTVCPGATRVAADACCCMPTADEPPLRRRTAGYYRGTLRLVVHAFKYQGRRSLVHPLAALMRTAGRDLLDGADVVVPVPLHPFRLWSRGFNQAATLARHLGVPVADVLRRRRRTAPQVSLTAGRRRRNVYDAFELRVGLGVHARLRGRTIVIVDDVTTTGSTLEACAVVLRRAGARDVSALTAATTPLTGRYRRQPRPASVRRPR